MIDSHTHIGRFFDIYTSPKDLPDFLDSVGVDCFAVSSTTTCEWNCDKVLREIGDLVEIARARVLPVLWILPEMFKENIIDRFLDSGIQWRMLKIHPQISPAGSWADKSEYTGKLIDLARNLNLPILIHTGEIDGCYPNQFKDTISNNTDITFILAHGRPLDQTISIMKDCANCWCDTAFMPTENIAELCKAGHTDRVLWGSDYPIPKYFYPQKDMAKYYNSLLAELRKNITEEDFAKITGLNARILFKF